MCKRGTGNKRSVGVHVCFLNLEVRDEIERGKEMYSGKRASRFSTEREGERID